MAEATGVRVVGGARLRRTLKEAGVDMKDLTAIHKRAANIVLPVAKSTTPIGPEIRGHIQSTVRAGATRSASIIRVGSSRFPYAQPLHWGWHRRGIRPNPWVSRAAQSTEPRWLPLFWDELNRVINRVEGA